MRDLSKLFSDKILKIIFKQLNEVFNKDGGYSIHSRYEDFYCDIIDDVVKYYGLNDLDWHEYGFFFELIEMNTNYENENELQVPTLKSYNVFHDVTERQYIDFVYRNQVYSYGDESTIKGFISSQLNNDDEFSIYDGDIINEDIVDSDEIEISLYDVKKIIKK
jgi:hypothetical protein